MKARRRPIEKISDNLVIEALQIVHNYCNQEVSNCSECMLRMYDSSCIFYGEFPDRFDRWKNDNGIGPIGGNR